MVLLLQKIKFGERAEKKTLTSNRAGLVYRKPILHESLSFQKGALSAIGNMARYSKSTLLGKARLIQ
jgi:hypothetical protein